MSLLDMQLPNGVRLGDATIADLKAAIHQEMARIQLVQTATDLLEQLAAARTKTQRQAVVRTIERHPDRRVRFLVRDAVGCYPEASRRLVAKALGIEDLLDLWPQQGGHQ